MAAVVFCIYCFGIPRRFVTPGIFFLKINLVRITQRITFVLQNTANMAKTLEQRRAELELKSILSDCRMQLKAAARKAGYLVNNFSIEVYAADRAAYVSSNLNSVERGAEQCEAIMKECGYQWETVNLKHAYLNIYYSAYKISF